MDLGRAVCLRGIRVLVHTASPLANELELAWQQLRLPKVLAQYRRYGFILVDQLTYVTLLSKAGGLLFQFLSDRYECARVALTSNLEFTHRLEVVGRERMTAELPDSVVHHSHIVLLEAENYRIRQGLEQQAAVPAAS